jgi:UTP-glucose-1-phosphate uridylyltransferase
MKKKSLVVLAAGMGSRYGGLKQMDPVGPGGAFILDYTVFDALCAGFDKVVFVIRSDFEALFRERIVLRLKAHIDVVCVYQELDILPRGYACPAGRTKPWGTGHAVLMAAHVVDGPFAVVTADDFYGRDSFMKLGAFLDATATDASAYAMVGYQLRNTLSQYGSVSRGICEVGGAGELLSLTERTAIELRDGQILFEEQSLQGDELCSMSMFGFKAPFFSHLRSQFEQFLQQHGSDECTEFFLPTAVNNTLAAGDETMVVLETTSQWVGVTNKADRPHVVSVLEALVQAGEYPEQLWTS